MGVFRVNAGRGSVANVGRRWAARASLAAWCAASAASAVVLLGVAAEAVRSYRHGDGVTWYWGRPPDVESWGYPHVDCWLAVRSDRGCALISLGYLPPIVPSAIQVTRYSEPVVPSGDTIWAQIRSGLRRLASVSAAGRTFLGFHTEVSPATPSDPGWAADVTVPGWFLLAAGGVVPVRARRRWRAYQRRRLAGRCRRCGYDLRATPGRCPECGTAAAAV